MYVLCTLRNINVFLTATSDKYRTLFVRTNEQESIQFSLHLPLFELTPSRVLHHSSPLHSLFFPSHTQHTHTHIHACARKHKHSTLPIKTSWFRVSIIMRSHANELRKPAGFYLTFIIENLIRIGNRIGIIIYKSLFLFFLIIIILIDTCSFGR